MRWHPYIITLRLRERLVVKTVVVFAMQYYAHTKRQQFSESVTLLSLSPFTSYIPLKFRICSPFHYTLLCLNNPFISFNPLSCEADNVPPSLFLPVTVSIATNLLVSNSSTSFALHALSSTTVLFCQSFTTTIEYICHHLLRLHYSLFSPTHWFHILPPPHHEVYAGFTPSPPLQESI